MRKIRVKNFGPIKEGLRENDGFMDIKRVTIFIGAQGSGKSSVAKLISTFSWLEKSLVRGNLRENDIISYDLFKNNHCAYHGIHNYLNDDTLIEYIGKAYSFIYGKDKDNLTITNNDNNGYLVPKIMYVPSERNFVSAVETPNKLKDLPSPLIDFLAEFEKALEQVKEGLTLPINETTFEYDSQHKSSHIKGVDYKIRLIESSSGFQASVPLFLVTRNLALSIDRVTDSSRKEMSNEEQKRFKADIELILSNKNLTEDQKKSAIEVISSRFKSSCFINIVEEPEQNLYPTSQKDILYKLIEYAKMIEGNRLIITTHSPYIINYLTLAIKANAVLQKIKQTAKSEELENLLGKIVPTLACLDPNDTIIFELDDKGNITILENYKGLPSDQNYLNVKLEETNELFTNLLEIEDQCQ